MILTKIWERYFIRETLKTFFTFIICFYGLYVLIDYATHAASFHRGNTPQVWKSISFYYILEFIKRLEVLVPFALLLSTIKTLTTLNVHNELVALMASGVKLKTLMRPFILLAIFFAALLYINTEIFLPNALKELKFMDNARSMLKQKNRDVVSAKHLILDDGSTLIYQNYDSAQQHFFDAYWIKSFNEVYRIKFLFPYTRTASGKFVDHLKRQPSGEMIAVASYPEKSFPEMHFNSQTLFESITTPDEQSFSELWAKIPSLNNPQSEKQAQLISTLYFKLIMPLLCLLAVIGPIPLCVRFTRNLPTFLIYSSSIFCLVAFFILMDSGLILGERQVVSPAMALWPPFLILAGFLSFRFLRLR